VIQSTFEKEAYLKDLVIKLLQERNLSDFDTLDSLFEEIKQELNSQHESSD
jgi:flagellar basal body-associated protein FliL